MTPHRERAQEWARGIVNDPAAVYLDLETTGLGPDSEICDIAVVSQLGGVLIDSLVKTVRPIPDDAIAVHGVTNEMVADAPTWFEIYTRLEKFGATEATTIVIFNADYDSGVINGVCRRQALPLILADWQCAMKAFSDFMGTPGKYPRSFKWHSLDFAAEHFGIPVGGHRALPDTLACRAVVHAIASYTETPSLSEPVAVTVQPSLFAVETPVDAERWRR